jgi:hypothetical protein
MRTQALLRGGLARRLVVVAGIACLFAAVIATPSRGAVDDYGIESVSVTRSTSQAGAHPDFTTFVKIETDPASPPESDGDQQPWAATRNLFISLPPGMTGNPRAVAECSLIQFSTALSTGECPRDSQVGITELHLAGLPIPITEPIYNLEAPGGENVARLGFYGYNIPVVVNVDLRSDSDYGITAKGEGFPSSTALVSAETTLWGVPAASSHDTERITPKEVLDSGGTISTSPPRPSGLNPEAFMINPTRCNVPQPVVFAADSYADPGDFDVASAQMPATTGCESLEFSPTIRFQPTSGQADSPTGLEVELGIDQTNISAPTDVAPAHLKKVTVTLPQGMSLNPAAASGLGGCSESEVGLISKSPPRFNEAPPACPDSSKVGSARVKTPLLEEPIDGSLYLAEQAENPFGSLLAGYLVARGQGVTIKLAGRFDLDPVTGQIVATFDENPQQPFSDLALHFNGGDRGVLVTPPQCGDYEIQTQLVPWSAGDPSNPAPAEVVHRVNTFSITAGPGGAPCPNPPGFAPGFAAGTATPLAGEFSALIVQATRPSGSQILTGIDVRFPPGLIAKLAGVPYCPEVALAISAGNSGVTESASPSCPLRSRIGSSTVGVGAGSDPLQVQGSVYLSGPYRGAPLSIAVVTPALAGPFDLGAVVVRAPLYVNPITTQVRAVSDPLPTILSGIPLHVRSVSVDVDRPGFTRNPTSCEPMEVRGDLAGTSELRTLVSRFQVGGCKGLDFAPRLSLQLRGGTKRSQYPSLRAVMKAREGEAGIRRVSVTLPRSEFLAQEHIDSVCTRVQFGHDQCPAGSIYGRARVLTPLLEAPLQGPVYLRSNGGERELPDLVARLRGQIEVELEGRIDSVKGGGIRTTFASVPDAPVSKFVLSMRGGKKSLLVNSRDLCGSVNRARVKMFGHNGKGHISAPVLRRRCAR